MNFLELSISTTHEGSELVCDLLSNYSQEGVSVSDICDVIDLEKSGKTWDYLEDGVKDLGNDVVVKGYIEVDDELILRKIKNDLQSLKKNCPFDLGLLEIKTQIIDGEKWREEWKKNFNIIRINKIVVVPSWMEYEKKEDEITVILDSNMAFGTGEHETTSMCLEYLEKYVKKSDVVLDVGSGSGILGICASKLGAKEVIMTDIDECATEASEHNAKINGVKNATVLLKNLLDDNTVKGDVIVCNIMAEVLISFASGIANNLKENGTIILSGILFDRLEKVKKAYIDNGFKFVEQKIKGEWSALVLSR